MRILIEFDDNFGNEHSCPPVARFWTPAGDDIAVVMLPGKTGEYEPRMVRIESESDEPATDSEIFTGSLL